MGNLARERVNPSSPFIHVGIDFTGARHKWQFEKKNVTPNSMVILKDENLPPCKWTMGRILEIVKGSDGKVRVVKVKTPQGSSISSSHINTTSLTFLETIIRGVQGIYHQEEIQSIKKQISLPPKNPLRSLHSFIDEHGLVRVGGRLLNFQLRFNSKHPIILPSQQTISALLNKEQHIAHLHVGRLC
ncbi:integrase catalytic domain-containing protein [Trichonephila clavipes]|nr:integrase catalytic domain-containing protein [Trichonephila clavipes]